MNVQQINRLHRDEALAQQITAKQYSTFVAMPFGKIPTYDADAVYALFKNDVHILANQLGFAAHLTRSFAPLQRIEGA